MPTLLRQLLRRESESKQWNLLWNQLVRFVELILVELKHFPQRLLVNQLLFPREKSDFFIYPDILERDGKSLTSIRYLFWPSKTNKFRRKILGILGVLWPLRLLHQPAAWFGAGASNNIHPITVCSLNTVTSYTPPLVLQNQFFLICQPKPWALPAQNCWVTQGVLQL